jgi:hypothetical protein
VPYVALRLYQTNILVPLLSLIVFVHTLEKLREEFGAYARLAGYEGLIRKKRR